MNILQIFLITNSLLYFFGLLWASSNMDSYTLYGNISIATTSLIIGVFPKENFRNIPSYIVYLAFVLAGVLAAIALLLEDFSRKYGVNFIVVGLRFIFIFVITYSAYQYWKFRSEPSSQNKK